MKRILSLIFVLTILTNFGCSKQVPKLKTQSLNGEINVDILTTVFLKNKSGQNLLDPGVPDYYPHDSIYLFKLDSLGNEVILQTNPVWPNPYRMVFKGLGEGDNHKFEAEESAFLRLTKTDVDTVKEEFTITEYGYGNLYTTKLWYNGKLIWTRPEGPPVVIKENR